MHFLFIFLYIYTFKMYTFYTFFLHCSASVSKRIDLICLHECMVCAAHCTWQTQTPWMTQPVEDGVRIRTPHVSLSLPCSMARLGSWAESHNTCPLCCQMPFWCLRLVTPGYHAGHIRAKYSMAVSCLCPSLFQRWKNVEPSMLVWWESGAFISEGQWWS